MITVEFVASLLRLQSEIEEDKANTETEKIRREEMAETTVEQFVTVIATNVTLTINIPKFALKNAVLGHETRTFLGAVTRNLANRC